MNKKLRITTEVSQELLAELLAASKAIKASKRLGAPSTCPHINALIVQVSQALQRAPFAPSPSSD